MSLSKDEIALYDRQIRLWGMSTQLRLRKARILVINIGAVGTEVVKNLVLGGVNSLELWDLHVINEADFGCQFFLPNDPLVVGKPKLPAILPQICELNGRVNVLINTRRFEEVGDDYFSQFDLVIATELTENEIVSVNKITRTCNIPLYVAGMHGMFGYIITDLITHKSSSTKELGNMPRVEGTMLNPKKAILVVTRDEQAKKEHLTIIDEYSPISKVLVLNKLPEQLRKRQLKQLGGALPLLFALLKYPRPSDPDAVADATKLAVDGKNMCQTLGLLELVVDANYTNLLSRQAFTEFAPVAAILGGALAQDVIQFFGQKEYRINNVLVFDGFKHTMPIYTLY